MIRSLDDLKSLTLAGTLFGALGLLAGKRTDSPPSLLLGGFMAKDPKDNAGSVSVDTDGDLAIGIGGGLTIDSDGDLGIQIAPGLSIDF